MKKVNIITTIVFLIFFVFNCKECFSEITPLDSSFNDTVPLNNLYQKDGIYFYNGNPFSGVAISYLNGVVTEKRQPFPHKIISFKDGRKNGLSLEVEWAGGQYCLKKLNYINDSLVWIEVHFNFLEVKYRNVSCNWYNWGTRYWQKGNQDIPDSILYYYENKPFAGKAFEHHYPENTLSNTAEFKMGKLDGVIKGWDNKGNLVFMINYEDGLKNGKTLHFNHYGGIAVNGNYKKNNLDGFYESYYENAHTFGEYKEGLQEGSWFSKYPNGQTKAQMGYNKGQIIGQYKLWYENGKKQQETQYGDGKPNGTNVIWYDNGQIKEESQYSGGKKTGKYSAWYKNGQQMEEYQYIQNSGYRTYEEYPYIQNIGYGNFITWYESGQKREEYLCNDGNTSCRYVSYYVNGFKQTEGIFLKMILSNYRKKDDFQYIQDGIWTYLYENGDTNKTEKWKNGMLLNTLHFNWEGKGIKYLVQNKCIEQNTIVNGIF